MKFRDGRWYAEAEENVMISEAELHQSCPISKWRDIAIFPVWYCEGWQLANENAYKIGPKKLSIGLWGQGLVWLMVFQYIMF